MLEVGKDALSAKQKEKEHRERMNTLALMAFFHIEVETPNEQTER